MANKIGTKVRIYGMNFHVSDVRLDGLRKPLIILTRDFDGSQWYARTRNVTRFTNIKRVYDSAHANLDHYDVMAGMNEVLRRL